MVLDPMQYRLFGIDDTDWSFTTEMSSAGEVVLPMALPPGSVAITVTDQCLTLYEETIKICDNCTFEFYGDQNEFVIGGDFGISVEVHDACGSSFFWVIEEEPRIEIKINERQISSWELPITITWPDNMITKYTEGPDGSIITDGPEVRSYSNDDDPGPRPITITRGDGCSITLPIVIHESETEISDFYTHTVGNHLVYHGSFKCDVCSANGADYSVSRDDCKDDLDIRQFVYSPTEDDDPCNGGGVLRYYVRNESGQYRLMSIIIPPNTAISELAELSYPPSNPPCIRGGTCLFPSYLIPEIVNTSIPLSVGICKEFLDVTNPCSSVFCSDGLVCDFSTGECIDPCASDIMHV